MKRSISDIPFDLQYIQFLNQNSKSWNKFQLQTLILFLKSFPLLPSIPFIWCPKIQRLVYRDSKLRNAIFLGFVIVFEVILCEIWSSYLLWNEFMVPDNKNVRKMGMKKSLFILFFVVGMTAPISHAFLFMVPNGKDLCYDFYGVTNLKNYMDKVHELVTRKIKKKPKLDIVGLVIFAQAQGFVIAAYLIPIIVLHFRMDPAWELFMTICPECVDNEGQISSDLSCRVLFLGVRSMITVAWMTDGCRMLGSTFIIGWIFSDIFNKICGRLRQIPDSELAVRLYSVFWKISAGFKYWASPAAAASVYGGIGLLSVTNYATIMVVPKVKPLTLVYLTFPVCSTVGTLALAFLPYAVRYPDMTRALIKKWKNELGCERNGFKSKVRRRQCAAMMAVVGKAGPFHDLDKDLVCQIITTLIDQTINLIVTFPI